jgi:kynurenine formamidase
MLKIRKIVDLSHTLTADTPVYPGSEYGEGVLRGIIVFIVGEKVERTQMTSG